MLTVTSENIPDLIIEKDEDIAIITINRPLSLNSLNLSVFKQLAYLLERISEAKDIDAVIITGAGQKAFVAGADISEFTKIEPGMAFRFLSFGNAVMTSIENFPKPIIAAINGYALGGGCELAMACHIRLASDNAKFGLPEINLGILPGYGGTQRLPRIIGKSRSFEMMLTGEMIDAPKAMELGLINAVYSQEDLIPKAKELAIKIGLKPQASVTSILKAVNASDGELQQGIATEGKLFTGCTNTEDFKEGVKAFLEKRKPVFKKEKYD